MLILAAMPVDRLRLRQAEVERHRPVLSKEEARAELLRERAALGGVGRAASLEPARRTAIARAAGKARGRRQRDLLDEIRLLEREMRQRTKELKQAARG